MKPLVVSLKFVALLLCSVIANLSSIRLFLYVWITVIWLWWLAASRAIKEAEGVKVSLDTHPLLFLCWTQNLPEATLTFINYPLMWVHFLTHSWGGKKCSDLGPHSVVAALYPQVGWGREKGLSMLWLPLSTSPHQGQPHLGLVYPEGDSTSIPANLI